MQSPHGAFALKRGEGALGGFSNAVQSRVASLGDLFDRSHVPHAVGDPLRYPARYIDLFCELCCVEGRSHPPWQPLDDVVHRGDPPHRMDRHQFFVGDLKVVPSPATATTVAAGTAQQSSVVVFCC